ncbi:hypothetical protein WG66_012451 [Moniliophthora roreri]|nr:hypothetical protein WG66_012451 [Moniliophthora roreri]
MAGTKATQSHSNEDTKKKQQKRPLPYILVPPLLSDGPTGSEELCLHLKAESENVGSLVDRILGPVEILAEHNRQFRLATYQSLQEGEKEALQLRVSQLETRLEAEKELRKYFEQSSCRSMESFGEQ